MNRADLSLRLRYRLAKLWKSTQRVTVRVGFGCLLVLYGSSLRDTEERIWWWTTGSALVAWSYIKWDTEQRGQRKRDPITHKQLRSPTLRLSPEEAERIRRQADKKE